MLLCSVGVIGSFIEVAFIISCLTCWLYVSSVDPSLPGGIPCYCMRVSHASTKYCSICKKQVPGLDHHCPWLNTCVGKRNYLGFFLLTFFGTLQFLYQALFGLAYLIPRFWKPTDDILSNLAGEQFTYFIVLIIFILVSIGACLSFSCLCVFHLYLNFLGMGTYDWIMAQRPKTTVSTVKKKNPAPSSSSNAKKTQKLHSTSPSKIASKGNVELVSGTATSSKEIRAYSPTTKSTIEAKKTLNSENIEVNHIQTDIQKKDVNKNENIAIVVKSDADIGMEVENI